MHVHEGQNVFTPAWRTFRASVGECTYGVDRKSVAGLQNVDNLDTADLPHIGQSVGRGYEVRASLTT